MTHVEPKFLDYVANNQAPVTVFLLNGVKLQGQIISSDAQSILLKREQMTQMVYKHAISTIMPINPIAETL